MISGNKGSTMFDVYFIPLGSSTITFHFSFMCNYFDDQFLKGIKEIFKNKNHYRFRVLLGGVFYDGVNIANYIELNFCFC